MRKDRRIYAGRIDLSARFWPTAARFDGDFMKIVDERLDRMIEIADKLDVPLDHVVQHMGRVDQRTFAALSESPSRLPRYMKSSVSP